MTSRIALALAAALLLVPPSAGAQICAGLPPFYHGPLQASAAAAKLHDAMNVVGGIAIGSQTAFARLSAGMSSLQGREKAALELGAAGGVEFPGGPRDLVRVCVLGALAVTPGPQNIMLEDPAGTPVRSNLAAVDWSVGVTAGAIRSLTRRPLLLPTGSVSIVSATTRTTNTFSGTVRRDVRVFGIMEVGFGVVVAPAVTVRPMLTIPVGLRRASYGASLMVSTSLGR